MIHLWRGAPGRPFARRTSGAQPPAAPPACALSPPRTPCPQHDMSRAPQTCQEHHTSGGIIAAMTCSVQSRPTASHVLQGITGHPVSLPALNRARGGQWLRCHPTPRPQPQEHHMTVKNIRNHLPKVRWVMEMSSSWMLKSFARSVSCLRTSSDTCQRVAGSGFRI